MSNPTVEAANEATGAEPLNQSPTEPQPPKQQPSRNEIPSSLTALPPECEPVVFPLHLDSRADSNQAVSTLPNARKFEDLVKAEVRPAGPARAEEVEMEAWRTVAGGMHEDVVGAVRKAVDGGAVKVYKVETGKNKAEYFVIGLDLDGERMLGVRITGLCS